MKRFIVLLAVILGIVATPACTSTGKIYNRDGSEQFDPVRTMAVGASTVAFVGIQNAIPVAALLLTIYEFSEEFDLKASGATGDSED